MIALTLLKVTTLSAALTAVAAALITLVGWVVFSYFGAVTMIFLCIGLNLLLLLGFAGMVVGRLSARFEAKHPVSLAIAAGALLSIAMTMAASATDLRETVMILAPIILLVAAMRAWRAKNRTRITA